jgi:Icc-related predicted phosphoesterase
VTIEGSELERIEHEIRLAGAYSFRTTPDRLAEIQASPELSSHVFVEAMVGVARDWVKLAEERLAGRDVQCFIAPGNDDDFGIDTVLGESGGSVSNPEGQVIELRGTSEMIVCGYSNPTPWATPREEPEDDLLRRIEAMADKVSRLDRAVFCLHVPPYGSGLDNAALLDETLKPRVSAGSMIIGPVGSTAVRDAIRKYQPMVALHGHIHEGRGVTKVGRTPCINPGSEYGEGVLRGALLVIDDRKGLRSHVLVSG